MTTPDAARQAELLREQAAVLRTGEALGKSQALERLFAFLLACALEGRSPKEIEIAGEVFGRSSDSVGDDASIRVHVHRLRRKLDDFYVAAGAREAVRIVIPKGNYRLVTEPMPATASGSPPIELASPGAPARDRRHWIGGSAGLLLLIVLAAISWWVGRPGLVDRSLAQLQASPLWKSAASNARPVIIVVGDYYLLGERDADGEIARLVREFDINSAGDLDRTIASQPGSQTKYVDLGLNYLPIGVGNALRRVIPIIARDNSEALTTLRVVPASRMTPEMLKFNDIIYLGFLSGLGSLRDPVFSGSRFAIGDSYDEIVDRATGRHYLSGTHLERGEGKLSRDYALVFSFAGVAGNHVVVIAGTRDAALMQGTEFATKAKPLTEITGPLNNQAAFEALLAIDSFNDEGLRATLVVTAPRPRDADWSGQPPQMFPDDLGSAPPARSTSGKQTR